MNQSNISNRIYVAERKNIEEVMQKSAYKRIILQILIINNVINNQYEIQ